MESIGVLWGYGSENEFRACGANFIVETPEKLVGLLVG
jgi:phosphoglycolate phosphatase-like HAD superfamily hydrolase